MATSEEDEDSSNEDVEVEIIPKKNKKKQQTSITSFYTPHKKKRRRGRPKKVVAVPVEIPGSNVHHQEEATPLPAKKQRTNMNWNTDENWPVLKEALVTRRSEKDMPKDCKGIQLSFSASLISRTTLNSVEKRLGKKQTKKRRKRPNETRSQKHD
jgi:hypothetical protein